MFECVEAHAPAQWGLLHLVDPALNAVEADLFWRPEDCEDVLRLISCPDETSATGVRLNLEQLSCRIAFAPDAGGQRCYIGFSEQGRFLQLAVYGHWDLKHATLMVPALGEPDAIMARTASLRRLNDLLFNKTMRKILYAYPTDPKLSTEASAIDTAGTSGSVARHALEAFRAHRKKAVLSKAAERGLFFKDEQGLDSKRRRSASAHEPGKSFSARKYTDHVRLDLRIGAPDCATPSGRPLRIFAALDIPLHSRTNRSFWTL